MGLFYDCKEGQCYHSVIMNVIVYVCSMKSNIAIVVAGFIIPQNSFTISWNFIILYSNFDYKLINLKIVFIYVNFSIKIVILNFIFYFSL